MRLAPDVVLMDIRMPGMDGVEAARHLGQLEEPPAVIFITAYDEYALRAFDTSAVGYLLKPVRREKLADTLTPRGAPHQATAGGDCPGCRAQGNDAPISRSASAASCA